MTMGKCLGLFYADDDVVGSRDTVWLQGALNVLVGLFFRHRLVQIQQSPKPRHVIQAHSGPVCQRRHSDYGAR